jgi:hypothetical protein
MALPPNALQRGQQAVASSSSSGGKGYVNERLEFINGWGTKDIGQHERDIKAEVKALLLRRNPVLAGMTG